MLEALIRTKASRGTDKYRGDVICVKIKELADWGSMEIRIHKVVDWQDEELEKSMREQFDKTGIPQVVITPYKETERAELLEDGELIAILTATKTRSSKYFDLDLNEQKIKTQEDILAEFELNKATTKEEVLKLKVNTAKQQASQLSSFELSLLDRYDTIVGGAE
tara:strand:+ start:843 stop:1337 length:495 start_codon:yes stop_codon:yes gene_type:complete